MDRLRRALTASALVAAVVACGSAAPAQATGGVKAACILLADLKVADKLDPGIGMRLVGGKGTARFTSILMICIDDGKQGTEVVSTTATASGTYDNVVCGTTKFVATVESVDIPKFDHVLRGQKFAIETILFGGPFYWHKWDKPTVPDLKLQPRTDTKPWLAKNWQLAGTASMMLPSTIKLGSPLPDPATGHCAKAFTALIVMTIHHS